MLVAGGATDVTTYFALRLAADGTAATALTITGIDLQYVRSGAAPAAKVDATALAATDSAHADNKAIEIDATDQPGLYRVDWPDAAFAAGVREVILTVKVATAFTEHLRVEIDGEVNIAKAVWDRIISKANHDIGQSAGKILRQGGDLVQIDGAVSDATPSISNFDTNLTQPDTYFDDALLIFSNGAANAGLGLPVSAYLNANGNMTFDAPDDWPVTPVNGDDFVIFANHVHPVAQIADAVLDEVITEPSSVFSWGSATLRDIIGWTGALSRNKGTQTSTIKTLRNDADDADIATSTISDDATTFTREEWS